MKKKKPSYEEGVARIEEIAFLLENQEVSLTESIALYKEGMELTHFCKEILETAEKEVGELKKTLDQQYTVSIFDEGSEV